MTSWMRPSWPFSTRGTESERAFTAGKNAYPTTWGQRSRWWRWSSATSTSAPVPGWPSPVTRRQVTAGVYGDYLQDAQGEDVVAGIRNTMPLQDLEELNETAYNRLLDIMATLEHHYRDLCDIEFTVENGKLWMLQTRVGKRTAAAAFRIATQLVDEGVISMDEALGRVSGAGLAELMFPRFDESTATARLTTGMGASPGAAVGRVVFDSQAAMAQAAKGEAVILVRTETNPDDLPGMVAAKGILTRRGGKTSHAAVVARGMGKTCVVAAQELRIDTKARQFTAPDGSVIAEGDVISIDGKSGAVYGGEVPVVASPLVEFFEGTFDAAKADPETRDLVSSVERLLHHADTRRHLAVRANADMPEDARRGSRLWGGRDRAVPYRAHVPRRAPAPRRAAHLGG